MADSESPKQINFSSGMNAAGIFSCVFHTTGQHLQNGAKEWMGPPGPPGKTGLKGTQVSYFTIEGFFYVLKMILYLAEITARLILRRKP